MSVDVAKCPVGSILPLVENHWPRGHVESVVVKTPGTHPYPSSPQPDGGCGWLLSDRERLHGVCPVYSLRSLLIAFAIDEICEGPLHRVGAADGILFRHYWFLNIHPHYAYRMV